MYHEDGVHQVIRIIICVVTLMFKEPAQKPIQRVKTSEPSTINMEIYKVSAPLQSLGGGVQSPYGPPHVHAYAR